MSNLAYLLRIRSRLPITKLAPMIGVSRQAYHKWLRGKTITPEHVATLERLLQDYPQVEPIFIAYEVHSVSFACRCGSSLILKRRTISIISGVFCQQCHEHYWIIWSEGVLRNGRQEKERLDNAQ